MAKLKRNSNGEENTNERNKDQETTQMRFEIEKMKPDIEEFERKREHDIEYGKQQREVEILKMQTVRQHEHKYNMAKLRYDHDLAIKTKALEIMKYRLEIEKEKSKRYSRQMDDILDARKHKEQMAKLKQRDVEVLEEIQRMFCVESERIKMFHQQMKQDSEPAAGNAATLGIHVAVASAVALAHFLIIWTAMRGLQK